MCRTRDSHFPPHKFPFRSISFSQMANKFRFRAAPFLVVRQILPFRRPSFSISFLILHVVTFYSSLPPAASHAECQPDKHPSITHAHISQYLETLLKVSSRVSNISSGDPHFHVPAGSEAPHFYFARHIPTKMWGECPPPPPPRVPGTLSGRNPCFAKLAP